MRFCFIILCHLYLQSRLPFSRVIHSERIFIPLRYFSIVFQSKCATDVFEFECCALPLSSFIAASPRIIHHSKHRTEKRKKKTSTDLSRDQNTICVWTQYSNSCSSSAGRFVYGPTNTWMGHICFFFCFFYFALRHRPLSLPQPPPHQCCAGAGSVAHAGKMVEIMPFFLCCSWSFKVNITISFPLKVLLTLHCSSDGRFYFWIVRLFIQKGRFNALK